MSNTTVLAGLAEAITFAESAVAPKMVTRAITPMSILTALRSTQNEASIVDAGVHTTTPTHAAQGSISA